MPNKQCIAILDDCYTQLSSMKTKNLEQERIIRQLSNEIITQNNIISRLVTSIDDFRNTYSANDKVITTRSKTKISKNSNAGENIDAISLPPEGSQPRPANSGASATVPPAPAPAPAPARDSATPAETSGANVKQAPRTEPPSRPLLSYSTALRTKNKILVVGTNDSSTMRVIPKQKFIIVSRLDPDTTTEEVISHVKTSTALSCNAEKFMAFSKEYSSFKLGVNEQNIELLLKEELWPRGVVVRHFNFYKKRTSDKENNKKPPQTQ